MALPGSCALPPCDDGDQPAPVRPLVLGAAGDEDAAVADHAGHQAADRAAHVALGVDVGIVEHGVARCPDPALALRFALDEYPGDARQRYTAAAAISDTFHGQLARHKLDGADPLDLRAGLPAEWQAGDKTGTGDYGSTNDIAVLWPPQRAPVTLAIYLTGTVRDAGPRNEVVAQAARIVANWLA